jgi:hypothetical protein
MAAKNISLQGEQIGRIFAHWVIVALFQFVFVFFCFVFSWGGGGSEPPCAFPPPRPSIFSD